MIINQIMLRHPAILLPLLTGLIGAATAAISIVVLFNTTLVNEQSRLVQIVRSQAVLMESVARYEVTHNIHDHPDTAFVATMQQIVDAHKTLDGFGETGEFVIGKIVDGKVTVLNEPRFDGDVNFVVPEYVPVPMQRALSGESGHMVGSDYKGQEVLAAYIPVKSLNIGLVAKIDTQEVYKPFIFSAKIAGIMTLLIVILGVYASRQFSRPFIELKTEKKRAEDYLNMAGTIMVALDAAGNVTMINNKGTKVLGYPQSDIIGKNWFNTFIPEEARDTIKQIFGSIMSGDMEPVESYENLVLSKTCGSRLISWHNAYAHNEEGQIIGCLSAGEDVTEARNTEHALRVSERRFNQSQEFANIGTWDWNIQTGDLYWSPRIAPLFGGPKEELATTYENFVGAIHVDDREAVTDAVNACVATGADYNIEHRVVWPDGTVRWLLEKGDVVRDDDGNALNMLGVVQDITDNKAMQEQLHQSSKMATLGEMATGVAHELNQPLNVIRMAADNMKNKSKKGALEADYLNTKLNKVIAQVERAAAIIDHMRIFGRTVSHDMAVLDPAEMAEGSLSLVGEQLRLSGIDVIKDFQPLNGSIQGHQVQIEQVLLNLLVNARDALADKDNVDKRIIVRIASSEADDTIKIEVEDNGGGISQEHITRIFEPFYTTKEVGKGTGLGLSISYGIIIEMGGTMDVHNTDQGACFTINLPCVTSQ